MGLGGISVWQLLIILLIVIAVFGTKRFARAGWDFGEAIKGVRFGFKEALATTEELAPELKSMRSESKKITKAARDVVK